MIDRELATKLAKRFHKLSSDMNDSGIFPSEVQQQQDQQQAVIPEPPPFPPVQKEQKPPFRAISDNEWTDMDQLIGQTLQSFEVSSRNESNNVLSSKDYAPEPLKKPLKSLLNIVNNPPQEEKVNQPEDLSFSLPRCSAPIVPIVHHKNSNQKQLKSSVSDDSNLLQKERSELEAKLAKQRQKKSMISMETKSAAHPLEDLRIDRETEISQFVPFNNSPPILLSPGTTSSSSSFSESQFKDSKKVLPPVPNKKSVDINQALKALNSQACCMNSQLLANKDGDELAAKLARRNMIIEGETVEQIKPSKFSIYSEFHEFTRKQIKYFMDTFKKYDEDHDNYIDFNELKRMMEKLGEAQTHIALKNMLKLVDEDQDGKISPREFMLIFRYASTGQLSCAEVFNALAASVDVVKQGVHAAADFFEAKIEEQTKLSKFEEEIRAEKEERKLQEAEKKERRQQFLANKAVFT